MKKTKLLMLFTLAFLIISCREELDYVNNNHPTQNSYTFTKDNVITKQLFKYDYENKKFLQSNVEAINEFLKQDNNLSSSKLTSKNAIIGEMEVYTDVFEEVDYLNAKYYSFYILGTAPNDYEQKLILKYVDNQITEKHIIKYKRLANLQIDPNSYQLEKLTQNPSGNSSSKVMYIDTFSVGCTTYMMTTFNCGHSGNHSNGQYCDVEQAYMPHDILVSYNNPNCNVGGGGGGYSGTPGGGDGNSTGGSGGGGGGGGVIDTPTTPSVITIPTVAPIYSIRGVKTGTVKNPPDFNPLGLNNMEITQINSNDQFRLKIYQFLALKQLYPFDFVLSEEQQIFVKALLKYIQDNPNIQINDLNHEFLNTVYEFLQENYADINTPLEIFNRFKALDNALTQNPNLLLDIPCNKIDDWKPIADHLIPQSVKDKLKNINTKTHWYQDDLIIQNLDNAKGKSLNMDLFSVKISNLPNKPGTTQKFTAKEFFDYFRLHLNDFAEKFTPVVDTDLGVNDTALWNSTNPLNALISIYIPVIVGHNNGTVICSGVTTNTWVFTTITSPWDSEHPVSGNRFFSYYMDPNDNTMYLYTRGLDRVNMSIFNGFSPDKNPAFNGADELWKGMQIKIKNFVKDNGGGESGATVMPPEIYRPDWVKVKDYIRGNKPLSSLGCK
ncbi:hypothetical protein ACQ7CX_17510 [Chryseobacterium arthrosphaerae]|uniref:hypothetical protein n=1 Tax=Chryseobacterium arthrosphaerae TaxID=651561 RepID=UPI001BB05B58|nr:hypothetical protein [Chryseobacterium arthrosphaerae]QUY55428.1 hypothetical protein I2F65_21635 [Chryseobacterium arthrosphaerae]